jgi:hypothetical protein
MANMLIVALLMAGVQQATMASISRDDTTITRVNEGEFT